MATKLADLLAELARVPEATPTDLRSRLEISSATLSRLIAEAGDRVCRLGRARATRYAQTRTIEQLGRSLPVLRVNERGQLANAGTLLLLREGRHSWERPEGGLVFSGLPPALADMAPQGYLGQGFPARHPDLHLPSRISDWSDDHRLIAIARRGEDCVGDLVVGDESLERFLKWSPIEVTPQAYPELARRAASDVHGSSAGGERPKFGAFVQGRHVLVKFAPGEDSSAARQWRDLLWCEWRALKLLAEARRPAALAECMNVDGWRFLEVVRFDRIGERGRRAVLTLSAIDNEYFGSPDTWTDAAGRLGKPPFSLPPTDAEHLRWLDAFGQLMGNTDRHFGNIAFFVGANGALRLAPAYDMLPMILAPVADGMVARELQPAGPTGASLDVWRDAATWAQRFWGEVEANGELLSGIREYASRAAAAIAKLGARVSP